MTGVLIVILLLLSIYGVYKIMDITFNGRTDEKAYYHRLPVRYIKIGSYIKVKNEWYEIIHKSSEWNATMEIALKREIDGEGKTIEVSPDMQFKYKILQSL